MSSSPASPLGPIRRKNRAINEEEWIREVLHKSAYGVFATVKDDLPWQRPSLYVTDDALTHIYFHSIARGETSTLFEEPTPASFCVSEIGQLLFARAARDFSTEYASVLVYGTVSIVEDTDHADAILRQYFDKYFPHLQEGVDYTPFTDADARRTTVYGLRIKDWRAKRNVADPDSEETHTYPWRIFS